MKKIVGSVVLAILITGMGLPFSAVWKTQPTHACCLAHGAHQCSDTTDHGGVPEFSTVCPYHTSATSQGSTTAVIEVCSVAIQLSASPIRNKFDSLVQVFSTTQPTGRAPPTSLL